MTIGVDVYQENGQPRWVDVRRAGIGFCVVRAMENTSVDTKYDEYVAACRAAGIVTSAYHLLHWGHAAASPEEQMHALLSFIGPQDRHQMPPCIDVEFPDGREATGLTAGQAYDWLLRAVTVARAGLNAWPMIYTSSMVWTDPASLNNVPGDELVECPLWVKYWPFPVGSQALYSSSMVSGLGEPLVPPPWRGAWGIHQYQGDVVNCPGFATKVDMNRVRDLSLGDNNATVAWCQRRAGGLVADGVFGPKTDARIKEIQANNGLAADGIVGYFTMSLLAWMNP